MAELRCSFSDDRGEKLEHYGIPGMKWGVRNAETERKYAGGTGRLSRVDSLSKKMATTYATSGSVRKLNRLNRKLVKAQVDEGARAAKMKQKSGKQLSKNDRDMLAAKKTMNHITRQKVAKTLGYIGGSSLLAVAAVGPKHAFAYQNGRLYLGKYSDLAKIAGLGAAAGVGGLASAKISRGHATTYKPKTTGHYQGLSKMDKLSNENYREASKLGEKGVAAVKAAFEKKRQ